MVLGRGKYIIQQHERQAGNTTETPVVGDEQDAAVEESGRGMNGIRCFQARNTGAKTGGFA